MSAYLCNPEHIAALAAFASTTYAKHAGGGHICALHDLRGASNFETAANVAHELGQQNINSLIARYPNDKSGDRPGPADMTDDVYLTACVKYAAEYMRSPTGLKPLDIISMSKCYEYQSCESADWRDTKAHQQIQWIISEALRRLPGYDNAVRDYHGKQQQAA